jgi:hypothetical protein
LPILSVRSHMSVVLVQIDVKGYVGHCSKLNRRHWIEECRATGQVPRDSRSSQELGGDLAAVGPAVVCIEQRMGDEKWGRRTPHQLLDQGRCGGSGEVSAARVSQYTFALGG